METRSNGRNRGGKVNGMEKIAERKGNKRDGRRERKESLTEEQN